MSLWTPSALFPAPAFLMEELYILSHKLFVGGFAFYGNRECHGQFGVYELVAASDTLFSLCTINMWPWRLFVGGNLRLVIEHHESRFKEAAGGKMVLA
jgi:hypothetical protein